MAVTNTYSIDLKPRANPVVVTVSQYDEGRQITFNVKNNGSTFSLSGYSASIVVKTRSTRVATMPCTISGSSVNFSSTAASTLYSGRHMGELRIMRSTNEYIGSCNFVWEVEPSPENDFIPSEDEENIFASMLTQAQQAASQAQSYYSQMQALVEDFTNLQEKRYVFIGDSYGAGLKLSNTSNNWINKVKTYMGLSSSQAYSSAVDGSGFIGQTDVVTFKQQFDSLNISNPELITDVVVLGGWNDGGKDADSLLSAINTFIDAVEVRCPNATVNIGMVTWCDSYKRHSVASENNPTNNIRNVLEVYSKCGRHGAAFIEGIQYVLHNMTYFTSDGLHPNESGQEAIATHLANYLRGGKISVIYENWRDTGASAVNPASTAAWIYTYLNNNRCRLLLYQEAGFRINFSSAVTFDKAAGFGAPSTQYHDVFTFSDDCCLRGGRYTELQYSGPCMYKIGDVWYQDAQGFLRVGSPHEGKSKTLQVALAKTTGSSGYATISNVNEIWFPMSNIFMEADPMHC